LLENPPTTLRVLDQSSFCSLTTSYYSPPPNAGAAAVRTVSKLSTRNPRWSGLGHLARRYLPPFYPPRWLLGVLQSRAADLRSLRHALPRDEVQTSSFSVGPIAAGPGMAVIRPSRPLLRAARNGALERLSAPGAGGVAVTLSLAIGGGFYGEDCEVQQERCTGALPPRRCTEFRC
jgi:hypothetical protein